MAVRPASMMSAARSKSKRPKRLMGMSTLMSGGVIFWARMELRWIMMSNASRSRLTTLASSPRRMASGMMRSSQRDMRPSRSSLSRWRRAAASGVEGAPTLTLMRRSSGWRFTRLRGRGLTSPPSTRVCGPMLTGLNTVGMEIDERMARKRLPLRKATSRRVSRSVATAQKGMGSSSMRTSGTSS